MRAGSVKLPLPPLPLSLSLLPASTVARLVRAKDCRWNGQSPAPELERAARRRAVAALGLRRGGDRASTSGPRSSCKARPPSNWSRPTAPDWIWARPRWKSRTKRPAASQILTPEATFVDQGTEFGVEVSPGGSSKVHVFQGLVDVDLKAREGRPAPDAAPAGQIRRAHGGGRRRHDPGRGHRRVLHPLDGRGRSRPARRGLLAVRGPAGGHPPAGYREQRRARLRHGRFVVQRQRPVHRQSARNRPMFSADVPAARSRRPAARTALASTRRSPPARSHA